MREVYNRYDIVLSAKDYNWYDNFQLLLKTLESIELIESTLAIYPDSNLIERNAFILLNLQCIGAAQERLSLAFTEEYPTLRNLGFTETIKKKNKSWFGHDRRVIAHILDLTSLACFEDSNQAIQEDLMRLKAAIVGILKEVCQPHSEVALFNDKLAFNPEVKDILKSDHLAVENLDNNSYLNNIANALTIFRSCLTPQEKKTFLISPARQALMLLAEEVIGNNINLYYKGREKEKSPNVQELIKERNFIAHATLFRDLICNPRQKFQYLQNQFGKNGIFSNEFAPILQTQPKNIKPIQVFAEAASTSLALSDTDISGTQDKARPTKSKTKRSKHKNPKTKITAPNIESLPYSKKGFAEILEALQKEEWEILDQINDINEKFIFQRSDTGRHKQIVRGAFYNAELHMTIYSDFLAKARIPNTISFPLIICIIKSKPNNLYDILQQLANFGCRFNVEILDKHACTYSLLHQLINDMDIGNNIELVRCLMKNGVDLNIVDIDGKTPLYYLVRQEKKDIIREFIEHGAIIDQPLFPNLSTLKKLYPHEKIMPQNLSPFHYALTYKPELGLEMLKWYVMHKQDLTYIVPLFEKDLFYQTTDITFQASTIELISRQKTIGECGMNIYSVCKNPEKYELHKYVLFNEIELVKEYLKNKSPQEIMQSLKYTVELLPNNNDSSNQYNGYRVRELAEQMGHKELQQFLIEEEKNAIRASLNNQVGQGMSR